MYLLYHQWAWSLIGGRGELYPLLFIVPSDIFLIPQGVCLLGAFLSPTVLVSFLGNFWNLLSRGLRQRRNSTAVVVNDNGWFLFVLRRILAIILWNRTWGSRKFWACLTFPFLGGCTLFLILVLLAARWSFRAAITAFVPILVPGTAFWAARFAAATLLILVFVRFGWFFGTALVAARFFIIATRWGRMMTAARLGIGGYFIVGGMLFSPSRVSSFGGLLKLIRCFVYSYTFILLFRWKFF